MDPDNRVVARTLESEWEARLQDLAEIRRRLENAKHEHRVQLTDEDRSRIRALARDLPAVWRAPTTTQADRKAMLRLVIEAVAIHPIDVPRRLTQIRVQWKSGAVDELTVNRPGPAESIALRARRLNVFASSPHSGYTITSSLKSSMPKV